MRSLALVVLLCMALFLPAQASSFEDFNHGLSAFIHGENDTAISFFDKALAAGDLAPDLQAVAYLERGIAHARKREIDTAIADLSASINLKPGNLVAYETRAGIYSDSGNLEAAIVDLNSALTLSPGDGGMLFNRGLFEMEVGRFDAAATDIAQSFSINHKNPYRALWLELARLHAGAADPAEFQRNADALDLDGWPEPIVKFYLGRMSVNDVQSLAAQGDTATQKNQICQANFYVGAWDLLHQDTAAAKPLLQAAAAVCPKNFIELPGALAELRRLNGEVE